jgi:membrane-bound ClpP family serine protease
MSDWRRTYWQSFNIVGRIVGVLFALVGAIFIIYGLSGGGAVFAIPGLVVAVLGVLLFFAKPYRPDLRDSASSESADSHKAD